MSAIRYILYASARNFLYTKGSARLGSVCEARLVSDPLWTRLVKGAQSSTILDGLAHTQRIKVQQ